jgi:leader peptidase (prepilin peptidase)/N-methyltransferase
MPNLVTGEWLAPVLAAPFIGSFLGVLVERLPAGAGVLGVLWGRSCCPACRHRLAPRDLVPVFSWLLSRGRCRHCAAPLSAFYPGIEIGALAVALWAAAVLPGWLAFAGCGLGWALLALAAADQRHMVLFDELTLPLIPAGLVVAYFVGVPSLWDHVYGALGGFAAFAAIALLYRRLRGREGLGLGDAKLLAAAGAWVSWVGLPSVVLLAAASALVMVLVRAALRRRLAVGEPIAFGPHLCLATWLVWLYGPLTIG